MAENIGQNTPMNNADNNQQPQQETQAAPVLENSGNSVQAEPQLEIDETGFEVIRDDFIEEDKNSELKEDKTFIVDENNNPIESEKTEDSESKDETSETEESEAKTETNIITDPVEQQPVSLPYDDNDEKTIQAAIAKNIKEDYIPGSKEFRDGVREEAKAAVLKEMNLEEFDIYNDEAQVLFVEKLHQITARRENAYRAAVDSIKNEYGRDKFIRNLKTELGKIIDTPEKNEALESALGGMSVNAYTKLQKEISSGNSSGLIKFARTVVDKMSQPVSHRNIKNKVSEKKPARSNKEEFASDLIYGGNY